MVILKKEEVMEKYLRFSALKFLPLKVPFYFHLISKPLYYYQILS